MTETSALLCLMLLTRALTRSISSCTLVSSLVIATGLAITTGLD